MKSANSTKEISLDIFRKILKDLSSGDKNLACIIPWASPVPFFGDPKQALLATIGINPSDKEFINSNGYEISNTERRFHTLTSLKLETWDEITNTNLKKLEASCLNYFQNNPYNSWFSPLNSLISSAGFSYYSNLFHACHLDIIPFATSKKWGTISNQEQLQLIKAYGVYIGYILSDSKIETIILNGTTVIRLFSNISNVSLTRENIPDWDILHSSGNKVRGLAFRGHVSTILGIELGRKILVLGYNHNIQSSFGVSSKIRENIKHWIQLKIGEAKNEDS